eukprot:4531316-Prymnesium_polylepis.1
MAAEMTAGGAAPFSAGGAACYGFLPMDNYDDDDDDDDAEEATVAEATAAEAAAAAAVAELAAEATAAAEVDATAQLRPPAEAWLLEQLQMFPAPAAAVVEAPTVEGWAAGEGAAPPPATDGGMAALQPQRT